MSSTSRFRGRARLVWTGWTDLTASVPSEPQKAISAREDGASAADFYVVFPNVPKRDNVGS
jgi:hypothetical protein